MPLIEKQDYVFYESGTMMNSMHPLVHLYVCIVSTKNYVFYIPKKSIGTFVIFTTIKEHDYFNGVSIEKGVKRILEVSKTVEDLEKLLIYFLEEDDKYVHRIADKKSFKFRGVLGKHTLKMSTGRANWSSILANGKGNSKEFREFHGQ